MTVTHLALSSQTPAPPDPKHPGFSSSFRISQEDGLFPAEVGGSLYDVSSLRNLTSALRTTGLLLNYTAEHHMIHVSSSPAPSAPSWLV